MDIVTHARLVETASALVTRGKGVLAADESPKTLTARFQALGIASTPESRSAYRELLFATEGVSRHISGVILNEETLGQCATDGRPFADVLLDAGLLPGIKVDRGLEPLAWAPEEQVTEGLDGLRDRFAAYRDAGSRFAKWRALFRISPQTPSDYCIEVNAHALARYAALAQEAGLVPMVEAEVLLDGDHDLDACTDASERVLRELFAQICRQRVELEAILLKTNMVLSGKDATCRVGAQTVAERTIACLMETVPAAVPGVLFLSGGQGDDEATENLNAICLAGKRAGAPWQLSFSYARALQGEPMRVWAGRRANVCKAQSALVQRVRAVGAARQGEYAPDASPQPALV